MDWKLYRNRRRWFIGFAICMAVVLTPVVIIMNLRYPNKLKVEYQLLKERYILSTEGKREGYAREYGEGVFEVFATKGVPTSDQQFNNVMIGFQEPESQAITVESVCFYNIQQQRLLQIRFGDSKKNCKENPPTLTFDSSKTYQNDIAVDLNHLDNSPEVSVAVTKLLPDAERGKDNVAKWSIVLLGNVSPDETFVDPVYSPAWSNGASILLNLALGCFVLMCGWRLLYIASHFTNLDLRKGMRKLHDARASMVTLDRELNELNERQQLQHIKKSLTSFYESLELPMNLIARCIRVSDWGRRQVFAWENPSNPTDVADIVKRVVEKRHPGAKEKINFKKEDTIAQHVSESDAHSIVENLINNALEHGEPPINIIVRRRVTDVLQEEPALEIVVTDNGYLYREAQDEKAEGRGHGLKLIDEVARKYGGSSHIKPGENGRGTVVHVRLPDV